MGESVLAHVLHVEGEGVGIALVVSLHAVAAVESVSQSDETSHLCDHSARCLSPQRTPKTGAAASSIKLGSQSSSTATTTTTIRVAAAIASETLELSNLPSLVVEGFAAFHGQFGHTASQGLHRKTPHAHVKSTKLAARPRQTNKNC